MGKKKTFALEIFSLTAATLLSPLQAGGESWHTALWLRALIPAFAVYYFWRQIRAGKLELKIPAGGWALLGFVICLTITSVTTHYYFITCSWYLAFLNYLLLFLLGLAIFSEAGLGLICALPLVFLAAGLVESGIGIYQHFRFHPDRVPGTFFNPSYYAGYLAGLIAFPFAGLVFGPWPGWFEKRATFFRIACAVLSALIFAALVFSGSRSAVFALLPLGLILIWRFRLKALAGLAILVLILAAVPNPLRTRITNLPNDPNSWERLGVWRTSLRMIARHPAGVGLGMYGFYYQRYTYPLAKVEFGRYGKQASQAHNEFLNFAAECSPLAPVFAIAFLIITFRRVRRAADALRYKREARSLIAGFSGAVLAMLGHSLVDYNLHQPPIAVMAAISLAALIAISAQVYPDGLQNHAYIIGRPRAAKAGLLALAILMGLLMAAQTLASAVPSFSSGRRLKASQVLARLHSGFAPAYFDLGGGAQKAADPKMLPWLEQAAKLNPEDQEYFYWLARSYYDLSRRLHDRGPIRAAQSNAQKAIALAPGQVFSYLLLSDIYLAQQDLPAARKVIQTALDYEPYFLRGRARLVELLLAENDRVAASAQFSLLQSQAREVAEFEAAHPNWLNQYQRQVVRLRKDELDRILQLLE